MSPNLALWLTFMCLLMGFQVSVCTISSITVSKVAFESVTDNWLQYIVTQFQICCWYSLFNTLFYYKFYHSQQSRI